MALSHTSRRRRLATAIGALLLAAAPLSGCGGADSPSVKDLIDIADGEGSIDTDGDGRDDLSIQRDGDGVALEGDDGSIRIGDHLPDDFPSEVPLIDGEVVQGSSYAADESRGWVVGIHHAGALPATVERVAAELTGAGFAEVNRFSAQDGAVLGVTRDSFTVQVTFAVEDDGTLVAYTVARSATTS